uniref:Uncharacterized protein n=1 Tax=Lotus japonicus TaxID=34305 RepID=I3T2W5_LOTJA|nr:unknown [Lotus japonicus]
MNRPFFSIMVKTNCTTNRITATTRINTSSNNLHAIINFNVFRNLCSLSTSPCLQGQKSLKQNNDLKKDTVIFGRLFLSFLVLHHDPLILIPFIHLQWSLLIRCTYSTDTKCSFGFSC